MNKQFIVCAIAIIGLTQLAESSGKLSTKTCSTNTADWCRDVYEAEACNVVEHCWKYVWSRSTQGVPKPKANAPLVNFTLYYETLCPDCRLFMKTQIWNAFQSVSSIMNLTLVPYGNAREAWSDESQLWEFTCQHGANECWGNLLHTCVLFYYPRTADHIPYIRCTEANDKQDIHEAAVKCAKVFNISMDKVNACMTTPLGNSLQHQRAAQTEALDPPHKYVPWVTLNGVHTEDIEKQAEEDLVALICDTYTGTTKPDACTKVLSKRQCLNDWDL